MSNDIDYIHLKGLGDPRDGRIAARAGDFGLFQKIFNKHLQTDLALTHMEAAAKLVSERATCLMCFESDPATCHRSIVAGRLAQMTGLPIMPLTVHHRRGRQIAA